MISAANLADGDLHHYTAVVNGINVRFFLYKKPDGKVATLFDACRICGSQGFYKTASGLVCKNCAAPVNPNSVGQPGGCNPIPLEAAVNGNSVTITQANLAAAAEYFQK